MPDSLVDKYARRPGSELLTPEPEALEADFGCFGWLRGVRERAICLELRKKDGRILALGYAWIDRMEYDPDRGITLHAGGTTVEIMGSGLNAEVRPGVTLVAGLIHHRVAWVSEVGDESQCHASSPPTYISSIIMT